MNEERESKVVFFDSANSPRSLRGMVAVEGLLVRIARRDGVFLVPLSRVVQIEAWSDDAAVARP